MRPMRVGATKPDRYFGAVPVGAVIGLGVGPFAQSRPDEALGLAAGLRRIWPGSQALEAEALARAHESAGSVTGTILDHNAFDGDPELC
jgi:hypothetical protein